MNDTHDSARGPDAGQPHASSSGARAPAAGTPDSGASIVGASDAGAAVADDGVLRADLSALREGAAVCAPGVRSAIGISGPDHVAWLDRISSMPVLGLAAGHATGATLMDGKGKLRADLRVLHVAACIGAQAAGTPAAGTRADSTQAAGTPATGEQPRLLLDVPASQHAALLRVLDMYILRDKVTLQDLGASHRWVSVLGPRADALLAAAQLPAPRDDEALSAGDVVAACASRLCGAPGTDLLVPVAEVESLLARLAALGARRIGPAALDVERLARGVPWFASELADGVIPLEAGLDADVSVTKGCYPGQEVVARITNLGQVTRRLLRLSAPGRATLAPGTPLLGTGERAGQDAGKLTSAAFDPLAQRTLALGYLRRAFWKPGTTVLAAEVELTVAALR